MKIVRGRVGIGAVLVAAVALSSCSRGATTHDDGSASSRSSLPASKANIEWTTCGTVQCGELEVRVDSGAPDSPQLSLKVFKRSASTKSSTRTLVLVQDRNHGYDARQLVTLARVLFGASVDGFDVVAIEPRGSRGLVMPVGYENSVATLDVVEDLETLRMALGVARVSVIGWGRGATAGAAWKMLHPESIEAMVLDTPTDPSVSTRKQGVEQIKASVARARAAVKWCASHLSCPLNANTTADLMTFKKHMGDGRLDDRMTPQFLARAATNALAQGDPRTLFVAIAEADKGDMSTMLGLAGDELSPDDVRVVCADVTQGSATAIALAHGQMTKTKRLMFHLGQEGDVYSRCVDLPPARRPLGVVTPLAAARNSRVQLTIATGDPTWSATTVGNLATRMGWSFIPVTMNRRLVVGFDRAATAAAMKFLVG